MPKYTIRAFLAGVATGAGAYHAFTVWGASQAGEATAVATATATATATPDVWNEPDVVRGDGVDPHAAPQEATPVEAASIGASEEPSRIAGTDKNDGLLMNPVSPGESTVDLLHARDGCVPPDGATGEAHGGGDGTDNGLGRSDGVGGRSTSAIFRNPRIS